MKWVYRIAGGLLVLLVLAAASLALVLSHTSPCTPAPPVAAGAEAMTAAVHRCYGSPDVVTFEEVEKPVPGADQVLVRVRAASVNPYDWHHMRGSPYIMRLGTGLGAPDHARLGMDFAGTVEAVGANVERFRPGDEVFGGAAGAFAEYVLVRQDGAVAPKPETVTFEQAAAVAIAATTALQALRDKGKVEAGDKVLINGASGGVGTFAVQIAKAFGAEVTGVCSTRNLEMVRSIGADHVFDYTRENYTESGARYDLIIDMVGNHPLLANKRVLEPDGIFVLIGGPKGDWIGPLMGPIKLMFLDPFVDQEMSMMLARLNQDDMSALADLMRSGAVTPVLDRGYSFDELPAAIRYSEQGHARGNIPVSME